MFPVVRLVLVKILKRKATEIMLSVVRILEIAKKQNPFHLFNSILAAS